MIRKYVLGFLVWVIYRCLYLTWRVHVYESPELKAMLKNRKPFVLAHWHGDEIPLMIFLGRYRLATIVSTSNDGEMMDVLARLMGATTTRGSSTRGGVGALKGLLRLVKEGHSVSFAVDGPKGPLYKVKPGVFELSRLMKAPIFYSGVYCDRKWVAKRSWNQSFLPKPFANVYIEWLGPLMTVGQDDDPRSTGLATRLEDALRNAKTQVEQKNCDGPH